MSHDVIVSVQSLQIHFQQEGETHTAVKGVSFDIRAGETLALVGESGSGKSVTALSLVRLIPSPPVHYPNGKITYVQKNGKAIDVLSMNEKQMQSIRGKEIACIFQEPMSALNPLMTCGKQVIEMIQHHEPIDNKTAREKALRLFNEVKLPMAEDMLDRYPHELSGGQKQRVMIAMAIACEPRLLIADEPTTALDVSMQGVIIDLLKELQAKYKMAILFISHDLNVVSALAQHIAVMYKGELVEQGPCATILNNPQHPYTKGLLACRPNIKVRVNHLATLSDFLNPNKHTKGAEPVSRSSFNNRIDLLVNSTPLLELHDVSIVYAKKSSWFGKKSAGAHAVNRVSLILHEGSTLGLLGESGSGKTSIGKALVRLNNTSEGTMLYKGQDIQNLRGDALNQYRREVQMIFQDPYAALNPRMRVGEAIEEPMHVHGLHSAKQRREKMHELLALVGLHSDQAKRYPHEFSGGQRQRITIARALALEPKLLVCDESVSALDVSVQAQVLNLLIDLREQFKLTYLFISHDVAVVKHISDFIAVMQQGKIVEYNNTEDLFASPKDVFTQRLLGG